MAAHAQETVQPIPKLDFPKDRYPKWIGHKFNPDGTVLPYPGHGVLAHLKPDSEIYRALLALREDLREQDFADIFALLPPSSWHMTIYEGISDQIRLREQWPAELPLDCGLPECHQYVASKLKDFHTGIETPIRMTIVGFEPLRDGVALKLTASDEEGEQTLRRVRDQIDDVLGMTHPGHATYSFHSGLAYTLRYLQADEGSRIQQWLETWHAKLPNEFELGSPQFCVYKDMCGFEEVFDMK